VHYNRRWFYSAWKNNFMYTFFPHTQAKTTFMFYPSETHKSYFSLLQVLTRLLKITSRWASFAKCLYKVSLKSVNWFESSNGGTPDIWQRGGVSFFLIFSKGRKWGKSLGFQYFCLQWSCLAVRPIQRNRKLLLWIGEQNFVVTCSMYVFVCFLGVTTHCGCIFTAR
jgi:hypothetical protein